MVGEGLFVVGGFDLGLGGGGRDLQDIIVAGFGSVQGLRSGPVPAVVPDGNKVRRSRIQVEAAGTLDEGKG